MNKKQLKLRSKPWVNSYIQKLIKHREKLLRKLRKSHSAATEELYKKFRKRVIAENRKSKIQYYENYCQKKYGKYEKSLDWHQGNYKYKI